MDLDLFLVKRFAALFAGNTRSYGQFFPGIGSGKNMKTIKGAITEEDFLNHLMGEVGVGVVPINDENACMWGAIDIDAHGDAPEVDIVALEKCVRDADLPLMVCRSKSGGAHLYLFCTEPVPAKLVRDTLAEWAKRLNFVGAEVFPKQDKLHASGTSRQYGNWINLCYFDALNPHGLRYCVEGGRVINLEYFVETAESRRVTPAALVEKKEGDHSEAPPCILRMMSDGVDQGARNEALYSLAIYFKKAFPESWRDRVANANAKMFTSPLSFSEVNKLISSIAARSYKYKCKEEPIRSLCNSNICVNRKFGISKEEKSSLILGEHPKYGPLIKYETNPVKWGLNVNEVEVNVTTSELMNHKTIREVIAEKLTMVVPPMKQDQWLATLQGIMTTTSVVEVPDEASTTGLIWNHLMSYLRRGDLGATGTDTKARGAIFRGVPVVVMHKEEKCVFFRGSDFVAFLRKNRSEEIKGPNLWFALKEHGVRHHKIRVGSAIVQAWYIPVDRVEMYTPESDSMEAGF